MYHPPHSGPRPRVEGLSRIARRLGYTSRRRGIWRRPGRSDLDTRTRPSRDISPLQPRMS